MNLDEDIDSTFEDLNIKALAMRLAVIGAVACVTLYGIFQVIA